MNQTSRGMLQRALEARQMGTVLKSTDDFDIFQLPPGFMDHLVLFLWKTDRVGAPPAGITLPVDFGDRRGVLCGREAALAVA